MEVEESCDTEHQGKNAQQKASQEHCDHPLPLRRRLGDAKSVDESLSDEREHSHGLELIGLR